LIVVSVLPLSGNLNSTQVNLFAFELRLDYLLHFAVYLSIFMFYLAGQMLGLNLFSNNSIKKFSILIIILATVTELIQILVPARAINIFDWAANLSGAITGLIIVRAFRKVIKKGKYYCFNGNSL